MQLGTSERVGANNHWELRARRAFCLPQRMTSFGRVRPDAPIQLSTSVVLMPYVPTLWWLCTRKS